LGGGFVPQDASCQLAKRIQRRDIDFIKQAFQFLGGNPKFTGKRSIQPALTDLRRLPVSETSSLLEDEKFVQYFEKE
jgi:hypothetical protein